MRGVKDWPAPYESVVIPVAEYETHQALDLYILLHCERQGSFLVEKTRMNGL
jgi:hypothetical protein